MEFKNNRKRLRFRNTSTKNQQAADSRNNHVPTFILYLPLDVFCFSVKLGTFTLASKARVILHYFHSCTHFFKKTKWRISRLRKRDSKYLSYKKVTFNTVGLWGEKKTRRAKRAERDRVPDRALPQSAPSFLFSPYPNWVPVYRLRE